MIVIVLMFAYIYNSNNWRFDYWHNKLVPRTNTVVILSIYLQTSK